MDTAANLYPDRPGARRVATLSLIVTLALAVAKLWAGLATGSIAVLSAALDSAVDVGATVITLFAVRIAVKPPDAEHPYGHGRAENLAAFTQAFLLLGVSAVIAVDALGRLRAGWVPEVPSYLLVLLAASIVLDTARAWLLRSAARRYRSQALEAGAVNFFTDVLGALAVIAGLLLTRMGWTAADPVAALVVVALVAVVALRLGRAAVDVLMDRTPGQGIDEQLAQAARNVRGVLDVSDVRVRQSGPGSIADVTVAVGRTSSVEQSHDIAAAVRTALEVAVPGTAAQVRVEPSSYGEDVVARTFAAANRLGLADQVHNVLTISHPEGLWLMLHAKVDPTMSLHEAHEISDRLEKELRDEISGLSRVEIHLEPREEPSLVGRVVSATLNELTERVRTIAESHPPISRCHEVAVSEVNSRLHLILHCEASPTDTIARIHEASTVLESDIHNAYPEVDSVTVHFEPS